MLFPQLLRRTCLAALALTVLTLPALAAPMPQPKPTLRIDKYLLDDTDGVLVLNVKQVLASPAYKRGFQKQVANLVALPEAQKYLKDLGFDPLTDVDRIIICVGKSCHNNNPGPESDDGPFVLVQGKFDSVKLKAKMAALAKDHPDQVVSSDAPGGHKIYRLNPRFGPFAAQLDSRTLVIAGKKAHVLEVLAKAAGKKQTRFVHKEVAGHLKKLRPDVAVQGFALEPMIVGNGTLGEKGFKEVTLSITIKDDARGQVVWQVKDRAQVKKWTDDFNQGLAELRMQASRFAGLNAKLTPLVSFLDGVTIRSAGQTITMEGRAEVEMVQALLAAMSPGR